MSSRPQFNPFQSITNASMTGTVISIPTGINKLSEIGYDISWTGSPVGTFSCQVSNTYTQNAEGVTQNPGNWTSLILSSVPMATGTPGNGFIDIDATGAAWIRLVYTPTSGTGTLNATVAAKVS
jgi:hypothetical protein